MVQRVSSSAIEIYGHNCTQYIARIVLDSNAYSYDKNRVVPFILSAYQKRWKPGERVQYVAEGKTYRKYYLFYDEQKARAKFIELHKAMHATFTPLM